LEKLWVKLRDPPKKTKMKQGKHYQGWKILTLSATSSVTRATDKRRQQRVAELDWRIGLHVVTIRIILRPGPRLEQLVLIRPADTPRIGPALDTSVRDGGKTVPAVLPFGIGGVGGAVGVDFDLVGEGDGEFATSARVDRGGGVGVGGDIGWGRAGVGAED